MQDQLNERNVYINKIVSVTKKKAKNYRLIYWKNGS